MNAPNHTPHDALRSLMTNMAIMGLFSCLVSLVVAAAQADAMVIVVTLAGVLLTLANFAAFGVIGKKLTDASQGAANAGAWGALLLMKVGLTMAIVVWAASNLPIAGVLLALATFPLGCLLTGLRDNGNASLTSATAMES